MRRVFLFAGAADRPLCMADDAQALVVLHVLVLIDGAMPQPTVSCASPKKCRNPVPVATWWLHEPKIKKRATELIARFLYVAW